MSVGAAIALSPGALVALAGAPVNPMITIVAVRAQEERDLRYHVAEGRHGRTDMTLRIVEDLRAVAVREGMAFPASERIVIQVDDNPIDMPSVSWETRTGWTGIRLIPDLYYFQAGGYEDFEPALAPWIARSPSIVWRGSSTGLFHQRVGDLDDLPRYKVCALASRLGDRVDVGITDVVQAADPGQAALIRVRLEDEGHLRTFVPFVEMARHRFILDIDGNANSWNFMMKLRLGCCVLRVESPWRQWFSDRLIAWLHYVPIACDLSDFAERVDWCFSHLDEAAAIAQCGKAFATGMAFADEVRNAARTTFAATG